METGDIAKSVTAFVELHREKFQGDKAPEVVSYRRIYEGINIGTGYLEAAAQLEHWEQHPHLPTLRYRA
jgi:hypothetical protein